MQLHLVKCRRGQKENSAHYKSIYEAMVRIEDHSLELVDATTGEVLREHTGPDGQHYVEAEPDQEFYPVHSMRGSRKGQANDRA